MHMQVLAGTGGQVMCLCPLLYPSKHSTAGQREVSYGERECQELHWKGYHPETWDKEQASTNAQRRREEVTGSLVTVHSDGPGKAWHCSGGKERAGRLAKPSGCSSSSMTDTKARCAFIETALPVGRAGSWSPYPA